MLLSPHSPNGARPRAGLPPLQHPRTPPLTVSMPPLIAPDPPPPAIARVPAVPPAAGPTPLTPLLMAACEQQQEQPSASARSRTLLAARMVATTKSLLES